MGSAAGALEPLRRVGSTFGAFTAAQKVIAVLGVAGLVLGGAMFYRWASEPTMTPLFSNLAMSDAGAITEQLDSSGTPYELADGGATILVPQDQVYALRLDMSAAGLPGDAGTGYALLDEQGVTASQFQQRTSWQRALEGELATTIGSISSVESARVQLAIPEDDVFADTAGTPTASVLVQTRPGQTLSRTQVQSVLNLVASSVEGMSPEDVTVVDGEGTLLSAAGAGGGAAGGLRESQTADYEARVAAALQQVLDRVVGPGKAVATVTADLDFDDVVSTAEEFTQPEGGPLALTENGAEEEYTGAGGALVGGQLGGTGILGPDNIAVPNAATEATDGTAGGYTSSSTDRQNGVNKTTTQTQSAPGAVRRQSVSVVVDTEASRAVDMQALQEAVTAAAGVDPARGDVVSVSQMPFDTAGAEAAAEAAAAADAAAAAAERTTLLQTAAVLLVVLLLLLVAGVAALRRRRRLRREAEEEDYDLGAMEALPAPVPPPAAPVAEIPLQRPALEQLPKDSAALAREQVVDLAERDPDEVAGLLRSWLTADQR
ncbi:flagellar basal-body MS-ring/collar protein FliF [Pseudokineococcus sp. 1T1Z-3]|uniref:flagellar basal-body MS-ring/collar protein FliF n=1 Tax=Pseudokineococcus sp. 1T1Z-3 TaxID=3132745 RepID=UPI0030995643